MKKVKDLKPSSQLKLGNFAKTWWGKTGSDFPEQDLNEEIGMTTSSYRPGYFLHHAIEIDDLDLVQDLCRNNINVNQIDQCCGHRTPLQFASDLGRANIVQVLLDCGAVAEGVKVKYTMNPCNQPVTFMWGVMEWAQGKTVDYKGVSALLAVHHTQPGLKYKRS